MELYQKAIPSLLFLLRRGSNRFFSDFFPGILLPAEVFISQKVVIAAVTDKQKRFCDEYLVDLNATQAAIRAGYSNKTAYSIGDENLRKPELKKYIDERIAEKQSQLIATQDEVLRYLTSVLRGEQKEQTLRMADIGVQEVAEINTSTKDRLRAAELLGKAYGAFRDKVDVSGTVPVVIIDDLKK